MQPELYVSFHKSHPLDCKLSYWIRNRDTGIVSPYSERIFLTLTLILTTSTSCSPRKTISNSHISPVIKVKAKALASRIIYSILIYIQQDATLHSLFYLETALHVSGGTSTHHQERKHLYLQHVVFVTPLLLSAAITKELELV